MKVLPSAGGGLQRLQVIQTRAQSPEFFRRGFVRTLQIEQVRLGRGLEGNFRHILQNGRIHSANGGVLDSEVRRPIFHRRRGSLPIMETV